MATNTTPPPGGGGGTGKYAIVGVVLLGAAIALYFGMQCGEGPPVVRTPDAGTIERPTALQGPDLEIPDPEPDAGPEVDAGQPEKRIVYRYVRHDWDCDGDIPAASASGIIRDNRRQVRNCYERALKRNHSLSGSISLMLRVGRDGAVTGVNVGGSLRDPEVFSCVRNLANAWRFPAPTGGSCAVISQSFNMTPQE